MKNTFSFRHDYGARNDPKIRKMISRLGPAAGWAWWVAVEELYEQGGRLPLESIPELAYDAHVEESLMKSVICDYGLFRLEKKEFYSPRVDFELKDKERRSEAAQKTANARWEREKAKNKDAKENSSASHNLYDCNASAMRPHCDGNARIENAQCLNEGNISEDKGQEDKIDADVSSSGEPEGRGFFSPAEKSKKITATQFVEVWNRIIREAGVAIKPIDARALGDKPRDKIQIRIREMSRLGPPLEILEQVMKKACSSMFCCGQSKGGWLMTFDWFIRNGDNWRKIYQGNYDDKVSNGAQGGYSPLHVTATKWEDFEGDF